MKIVFSVLFNKIIINKKRFTQYLIIYLSIYLSLNLHHRLTTHMHRYSHTRTHSHVCTTQHITDFVCNPYFSPVTCPLYLRECLTYPQSVVSRMLRTYMAHMSYRFNTLSNSLSRTFECSQLKTSSWLF